MSDAIPIRLSWSIQKKIGHVLRSGETKSNFMREAIIRELNASENMVVYLTKRGGDHRSKQYRSTKTKNRV